MWSFQEFLDEIRDQEPPCDLSLTTIEDLGVAIERMHDTTLIGIQDEDGTLLFDEGDLDIAMDNLEFYIDGGC